MTTPTTNYLVRNPTGGVYNDLGQLFKIRRNPTTDPSANPTGFQYFDANGNTVDLNNLLYPLTTGPKLPYKTNMISLKGNDLTNVFEAATIFDYINVDGLYTYSQDLINNYYILVFADYLTTDPQANPSNIGNGSAAATLTFKTDVQNVYFTLVGGGGGGGTYNSAGTGGGGGSGGGITQNNTQPISISKNTSCTIAVGAGGTTGNGGNSTVTIQSTSTTLSAPGGNRGGDGTTTAVGAGGSSVDPTGTVGAGGNGGGGSSTPSTDGVDGASKPLYTNGATYYFGGGGGGGSGFNQPSSSKGGLGGGGGGGNGSGGNKNQAYAGPNSILYLQGSYPKDGWPGTGGGGSAVGNYGGGNGASGIVICCFQLA